jgi:hypothetical protein
LRDISTALGIVIVGASLAVAMLLMETRLPDPPKYTQKEMHARERKCLDNHEKACYTCRTRDGETWIFCNESCDIQAAALTVGPWKMYPLGWVWQGEDKGRYHWDYKEQRWRR